MHPKELLALIHHTDQTTKAGIFGFEQGMEFTQGGAVGSAGEDAPTVRLPMSTGFKGDLQGTYAGGMSAYGECQWQDQAV
jgi:hypothetical protein